MSYLPIAIHITNGFRINLVNSLILAFACRTFNHKTKITINEQKKEDTMIMVMGFHEEFEVPFELAPVYPEIIHHKNRNITNITNITESNRD